MTKLQKLGAVSAVVGTLLVGSVAFAGSSFLDSVAKWTGFFNSEKLEKSGALQSGAVQQVVEDSSIGGIHSQSVQQAATAVFSTSATTTPISVATTTLLNSDGVTRFITGVTIVEQNSGSTWLPATFDLTTSTNAFSTSTGSYIFKSQSFATSTNPVGIVTSTFSQGITRMWQNGEYLVLKFNTSGVSSTLGAITVQYISPTNL